MKKILKLTPTIGLLAALNCFAAQPDSAAQNIPDSLKLPLQNGYKISAKFKAEGGLTGWVLSQGTNKHTIAYTTSNGKFVIAGAMLNAKGENLSEQYLEQYAPKPAYDKFWPKLEASAYIQEGATGSEVKSTIYVFMDPNCGYCRLAWKAFQPYYKVGLQVRWIPVGFLAADSNNKAAALLTAPDAVLALKELNTPNTKFLGSSTISQELKSKLESNKRLMDELGFRGTPATVYKNSNGKVQIMDGMPRLSILPAITGLPEQQQSDPDLARFK